MLKLFAEGVNKVGDKGIVHEGMTYQNCDVAVLQGFVHEHGKNAPHLSFRKQVLDMNTVKPKRCVVIDSNMFSFATGTQHNNTNLLRFSFDGIFPNTGDYCNHDVETDEHWKRISGKYNISGFACFIFFDALIIFSFVCSVICIKFIPTT